MTAAPLDLERTGPRERLILSGEHALSDAELLAVVLGTGAAGTPVAVLAQVLLERLGGLPGLQRASVAAISACSGVGPSKACRLRAALELGMRASSRKLSPHAPIRCSSDVADALRPRLRDESREHFFALALDVRQRPIAEILIAIGSLSACAVAPGDVFRLVLREPAAGVIFVHNHPSGEPSPSVEDIGLTERLRQAGALLGIKVVDHVILGHDGHFSFLDAGLLPP